ncbi:MAG TPA: MFS transporter [Methylomirabilota bacterium]|nr:MFS transporter [Methylomirabilota bacterium]
MSRDLTRRAPIAVLAAAFLFNVGQGALRPSLPLYLQQVFAARYQMVTLIPVVFGAGKWVASLPTGHLLDTVGRRPFMTCGLLVIALCDVASVMTSAYGVFLGLRALAGVGWAMFGTAATTTIVDGRASSRRGRVVSLLFMSETLGLLLGSLGGGWLYQGVGAASPFVFEAACMLVASVVLARTALPPAEPAAAVSRGAGGSRPLATVLRIPGVLLMGFTNAALIAVQTGLLVFLFPLHLVNRGHMSPGTVGLVVGLGVLGRLVALWLGGSVSDRRGRMRVLIGGLVAFAALLAGLTFLTNPVALGVASLAIGGAAGLVTALPTALIGDQVPPPLHGVAIGWLRTITDTGQILGPLLLGMLADAMNLSAAFFAGAALLAATAWQCRRRAGAIAAATHP